MLFSVAALIGSGAGLALAVGGRSLAGALASLLALLVFSSALLAVENQA